MKRAGEILPEPIRTELEKRRPERGYLARELVQCTLPHRDPGDVPYFIRTDGHFSLTIQPGINPMTRKPYGLPFGSIPRLLLLWLTSEAVRTQERRIELGNSLSEFLRLVGLSPETGRGKRGDAKRLKDQLMRLFSARFSFQYAEGSANAGHVSFLNLDVANRGEFWWDFNHPEQASFFDSYVILGEDFYRAITENPVPFDVKAIKALKRSPLAIDLYCWLCWRLHRLAANSSVTISYRDLKDQFGTDYKQIFHFKVALTEALERVEEQLPGFDYELGTRGLVLHGMPKEVQPIKAKRRYNLPFRERKDAWDLTAEELIKAGEHSQGWDTRALYREWRSWCQAKGTVPEKPLGHFIRFIKTHIKRNGSGL